MASLNKVLILGNLGADPELRFLPSGQAVCNFNVATSEKWTGRDGVAKEDTQWHRIVVWGKQGENCKEYLAKGRQVFVEGRLNTRSWTDQQGVKKYATDIVAIRVQFLGGGGKGAPPSSDVVDAPPPMDEPAAPGAGEEDPGF